MNTRPLWSDPACGHEVVFVHGTTTILARRIGQTLACCGVPIVGDAALPALREAIARARACCCAEPLAPTNGPSADGAIAALTPDQIAALAATAPAGSTS